MQQHICPESHRVMFLTATWHDDKKTLRQTPRTMYVCSRKCFWSFAGKENRPSSTRYHENKHGYVSTPLYVCHYTQVPTIAFIFFA